MAVKYTVKIWSSLGLLGLAAGGFAMCSRFNPQLKAQPILKVQTAAIAVATRSELIWTVSGRGSLVANDLTAISGGVPGTVHRIHVKAGDSIKTGDELIVLDNLELQHDVTETESEISMAESQLQDLIGQQKKEFLYEQSELARLDADYRQAELRAERDEGLYQAGLLIPLTFQQSKIAAELAAAKLRIEKERAAVLESIAKDQIRTQKTRIELQRSSLSRKKARQASLVVNAPSDGVIQDVLVVLGQYVNSGSSLIRMGDPDKISARVRLPDVQIDSVRWGQTVNLRVGEQMVRGRVLAIESHFQNGGGVVSVGIDAHSAPDLKIGSPVDAVIETERLSNTICLPQSVIRGARSQLDVFVLDTDKQTAFRRTLRLGRSTGNQVEVLSGINPGERFVQADDLAFNKYSTVRVQIK